MAVNSYASGILAIAALWAALSSSGPAAAQELSPEELQKLLMKPNGLARAAGLVGNFSMASYPHAWGDLDLRTLVNASEVVVDARLVAKHSQLIEDGDNIQTGYTFRPITVMKGRPPAVLTVRATGGKVNFSNRTSAEVTTTTWVHLQVGQRYLCFLRREDGATVPTNLVEGLMLIEPGGNLVVPLCSLEGRPFQIVGELRGVNSEQLERRIRQITSGSTPKAGTDKP